jgi:hypothetical protein
MSQSIGILMGGIMGATPNQVLSMAVLLAFHELWLAHPGTYEVLPTDNELSAALPQIFIKAFAADQRENGFGPGVGAHHVEGELTASDGSPTTITVRDVLNKIIHGRASKVEVLETNIWLTFTNVRPGPTALEAWTVARYSGTNLLHVLRKNAMNRDEERQAVERSAQVLEDLRRLGEDRFLPTSSGRPHGRRS